MRGQVLCYMFGVNPSAEFNVGCDTVIVKSVLYTRRIKEEWAVTRQFRTMLTIVLFGILGTDSNIVLAAPFQTPISGWTMTYGGAFEDVAYSIIKTSDNGYALAGRTGFQKTESSNFWLVKIDEVGKMQWNRSYEGQDRVNQVTLIQTEDGGYALAGSGLLVKTNINGDMIWNRTYLTEPCNCNVEYVVQTDDTGYALAGNTRIYGDSDFCLLKTDGEGKTIWNKTYSKTSEDGVFSLISTADKGYAMAGYTEGQTGSHPKILLMKTDEDGNSMWNFTFAQGEGHYVAYSVVQTNDGGYVLAGDNSTWIGGSLITRRYCLVKVDSRGLYEWDSEYAETSVSRAYSVAQIYDSGFVLAGYKAASATSPQDCLVVRTDAKGAIIWENTYGGELDDVARSVIAADDEGYMVAGQTRSFGAGNWDFWLVRTDENGVVSEYHYIILLVLWMTATSLAVVELKKHARKILARSA
jgi:hypothetical protein